MKRFSTLETLRKHGFSDREIVAFEGGFEGLVRQAENPELARRQAKQQLRNHQVRYILRLLFTREASRIGHTHRLS